MWTSGPSKPISYGFPPEMGMLGLRDVFLVAPAADPHQHHHHLHPHHHHHHHHSSVNATSGSNSVKALGVGVIPLLPTALPNMNDNDDDIGRNNPNSGAGAGGGGGIQLWQPNQQQHIQHHPIFFKKNHNHLQGSGAQLAVQGGGSASSSSSALTCQDCGNQAKKDCSHRRCRTCCKSRGFDCATHVKSTWVPAARRRERQLMSDSAVAGAGAASSASTNTNTTNNNNTNNGSCKKPRLIGAGSQNSTPSNSTYSNNTTPPRSYETTTSKHQDGGVKDLMPGQVRAPAVFKCVRVTAVDEGAEDEYAYQAVVKIGGHVFKGFLYDQGVEARDHGTSSSSSFPNFSDLHLGGGGRGGGASTSGRNGGAPILDAADDVYAAAAAGASGAGLLLGGSNFGNPMN